MGKSENSELVPSGNNARARTAIAPILICTVLAGVPTGLVVFGVMSALSQLPVAAGLMFSFAAIFAWFAVPYFIHFVVLSYEKIYPENLRGRIRLQQALLPLYVVFRNKRYHSVFLSNLGTWELNLADFEKAELRFRQALKIERSDRTTKSLDAVFVITANLANSLSRLRRYDEAAATLEPCVEAVLNTPDRFSPAVCWFIVFSMLYLKTHCEPVDITEAETYFRMTQEFFSRALPSMEQNRQFESRYAMLSATAIFYFKKGEIAEALNATREFLNLARYRVAAVPLSEIERFNEIAELLFEKKEFDLCEQFLDVAYRSGANEPFHPNSQRTLVNFEKLLLATDRADEVPDTKRWLRLVVALPPQA